jgi:hypothetical protein
MNNTVQSESMNLQKLLAKRIVKLRRRTDNFLKSSSSIGYDKVIKLWAKDTCRELSNYILDEQIQWVPRRQP